MGPWGWFCLMCLSLRYSVCEETSLLGPLEGGRGKGEKNERPFPAGRHISHYLQVMETLLSFAKRTSQAIQKTLLCSVLPWQSYSTHIICN